ncbi:MULTISPECIES: ABC transporter ATP-binding protein [unclassified Bradyrhizobium]|uniref:ABC transporter ATP-binding protein n=1 Tax=unclassified Bradyrhizobium TaxID=2631580 RepID=UPI0024788A68|nr:MULTISPECIES: ABC transporter ATP-binding protein [unclassified Bradyrhizobium]WGR75178.1 ABC transporter ATP-binding protein [Bradyrhizobium sp. ISRA426]WGR82680.1 ABC transporter ATP-binding protein [Bradyrhizobium sp. ISRA430]WGR90377.1 ABC transporter ATP-binding protein [Bradyrhizobium sp. ISRA432]
MLEIRNVDKVYRSRGKPPVHAVRALDMEVKKGEIVALLGSSGCGKTSTLRMIAGFESVTSGSIALSQRRIDELAPAKRKVAMAFEGYSLYPPLSIRENIAFALKAQQLPHREVKRRVDAIARLVEIEDILDSFPRSISGGQQQRVSLARALVRDADLYLLDEPMGQLEPQLRAVLRGRIKGLLAERGMTAIFVTHDQTEASALADRIAVMEDGVLQQFANEKELKNRPANLFVASFIGEPPMNLLDTDVARVDGGFRLSIGSDMAFQIPGDTLDQVARSTLEQSKRVRVGIRPQRIAVGAGDLRVRVVSNQWLGDQSHIAGECAGHLLIAVTANRIGARPGNVVPFALEPRYLHIFGTEGTCIRHAEGA